MTLLQLLGPALGQFWITKDSEAARVLACQALLLRPTNSNGRVIDVVVGPRASRGDSL
jgi:hypothetical protein